MAEAASFRGAWRANVPNLIPPARAAWKAPVPRLGALIPVARTVWRANVPNLTPVAYAIWRANVPALSRFLSLQTIRTIWIANVPNKPAVQSFHNVRILSSSFTLSHEGVCGASAVISFQLSSPWHTVRPLDKLTLFVSQTTSTVPLHIEPRVVFTDVAGVSYAVPFAVALESATTPMAPWETSAQQIRSLITLLSGQPGAIPLTGLAGSALHIAILAASNPASAAVVSGTVTLFQLLSGGDADVQAPVARGRWIAFGLIPGITLESPAARPRWKGGVPVVFIGIPAPATRVVWRGVVPAVTAAGPTRLVDRARVKARGNEFTVSGGGARLVFPDAIRALWRADVPATLKGPPLFVSAPPARPLWRGREAGASRPALAPAARSVWRGVLPKTTIMRRAYSKSFTTTALTALAALQTESAAYFKGDWLIEAPAIGLRLSYAYHPTDAWDHRILEIGDVEIAVPPGGGIAQINTLRVRTAEDGTGQSLRLLWEQYFRLEGVPITLKLLPDGEDYADAILLFVGRIDQVTFHEGEAEILASDDSLTRDILLPSALVTSAIYPSAAPDAYGRALGLVYGTGSHTQLCPTVMTHTDHQTYRAAFHAFEHLEAVYGAISPETGTLVTLEGQATVNASDATLRLDSGATTLRFGGTDGQLFIRTQDSVDNAANVLDGNAATYAKFRTSGNTGMAELIIAASFPATLAGTIAVNTLTATIENHGRHVGSTPTVFAQCVLRTTTADGRATGDGLATSRLFRHTLATRQDILTARGITLASGEQVELITTVLNGAGVGSALDYYEVGAIRMSAALIPNAALIPIFLVSQWTGRFDATGVLTGQPGASLSTIPDAIQATLVFDIGVSADFHQFAHARSLRDGWYCDGGLGLGWFQEQLPSRQLLDTLARAGAGYLFPRSTGAWEFRPYDVSSPAVMAVDSSDILTAQGEGPPEQRQSSLRVKPGPLEHVYNHFEIRYAWNPAFQKFDKVRFCSRDGTNSQHANSYDEFVLCLNSNDRYGDLTLFVLEAPFIAVDSTADLLLDHLVQYFWSQRLTCTWQQFLQGIFLEPGDFVTMTHPHMPTQDRGQKFEIHRIRTMPGLGIQELEASRVAVVFPVEYFAIKDQSGAIWYFWFDIVGQLVRSSVVPTFVGLTTSDLTPAVIPSWHRVVDDASGIKYLYPEAGTGELIIAGSAPANGREENTGTGKVARAHRLKHHYRLGATSWGTYVLTNVS